MPANDFFLLRHSVQMQHKNLNFHCCLHLDAFQSAKTKVPMIFPLLSGHFILGQDKLRLEVKMRA